GHTPWGFSGKSSVLARNRFVAVDTVITPKSPTAHTADRLREVLILSSNLSQIMHLTIGVKM
ncbi:MAG TPA: hypothetical protein VLH16_07090, partial [Bacteroidales bacterium]|nr:hypothetical protein [Bacteroidales bacterium]